jgi:hypothetical protein
MTVIKTSVLAACAMLVASFARSQTADNVHSDSSPRAQFRLPPNGSPKYERSITETDNQARNVSRNISSLFANGPEAVNDNTSAIGDSSSTTKAPFGLAARSVSRVRLGAYLRGNRNHSCPFQSAAKSQLVRERLQFIQWCSLCRIRVREEQMVRNRECVVGRVIRRATNSVREDRH